MVYLMRLRLKRVKKDEYFKAGQEVLLKGNLVTDPNCVDCKQTEVLEKTKKVLHDKLTSKSLRRRNTQREGKGGKNSIKDAA